MRLMWLGSALALCLAACNGSDKADGPGLPDDTGAAGPWRPDLVCPGDAGCETSDGPLQAGAAAVSITPHLLRGLGGCERQRRVQLLGGQLLRLWL